MIPLWLVLSLAALLVLAVVRLRFWKRRADHWFARATELEGEVTALRFLQAMHARGIEWPRKTHSRFAAGDFKSLIDGIPTTGDSE